MNSQFVPNMNIPNSQNSSEFIGNNLNLSNRRSRSRLRQISRKRSIIAEKRRTQASERARRYRERIRTNRVVNSKSVENVNIPNSQNSSEFGGNDLNLSNQKSRSCLRQTLGERSINGERRHSEGAERVTQFRVRYRELEYDDEVVDSNVYDAKEILIINDYWNKT